jgi:GTP-binding protein
MVIGENLEQAIAYIEDDELVEVTPKAVRIRKRFLDPHERKRGGAASLSATRERVGVRGTYR